MKRKLLIIGLSVAVLSVLVGITVQQLWYAKKEVVGELVTHDVAQLVGIFNSIHLSCGIESFEYQQNPINFLNVRTFEGSEVGPMNLRYPQRWQGPYLQDNPTIQEKEYMVVRTHDGKHFITPGNGVRLPNGKTIGTDIILDEYADIAALARDPSQLLFEGKPLALQIMM